MSDEKTEGRCPFNHAAGSGTSNRDWWPNQVRLDILHQHSPLSSPMDEDFDTDLESPVADLMQCTPDSKGDHILAARFLNRFVPAEIPWVHLDLAAGQRTGGLGHITTDITGFGVRYAVNLLTAQKILERAASGKQ